MLKTYTMFDLSKIKTNPENPFPSKSDSEFKDLVSKIERDPQFLKYRPIVVDPNTNYILGGNKRYAALVDLGYTEVDDSWVVFIDDLDEEQKRRFIFADNYNVGDWAVELITPEEAEDWSIDYPESDWEGTEKVPDDLSYGDDLPKSHVQMVQLILTTESHPEFSKYESFLREIYGASNITETVFIAMKKEYESRQQ